MAELKPFDGKLDEDQGLKPYTGRLDGEKDSALRRVADMTVVPALQGVVGVPEAAVGLADLVTGGYAGKLAEEAGFRPKEARQIIGDALYSEDQKAANRAVSEADGFVPTLTTMVQNPSTIARTAVESVPPMLAGGAISRVARMAAPALNPITAGAMGEGAIMAGAAAEQIRQETADGLLTPTQIGAAGLTGIAGGAISRLSGGLSNRLGLGDLETSMATGKVGPVTAAGAEAAAKKGILRRAGEGVVTEGVLEETPQSATEQVLQNFALDKPLGEGVGSAAAAGLVTGGVMGGVMGPLGHGPAAPAPAPAPAVDAPPPPPPGPINYTDPGPLGPTTSLGAQPPAPGSAIPAVPGSPDFPSTLQEFDPARRVPVGPISRALLALPDADAPAQPGAGPISRAAGFAPLATAANIARAGTAQVNAPAAIEGPRALPGPETITDNGQPFRNGIAAQRAARSAGLGFGVVPVEGGYVVRRTNDQAQDVTPRAPAAPPSTTPLLESSVDMGAHAAATSPLNDTRDPTDPQKYAENYRMGRAKVGTFHVSIENPQGSVRRGKDEDGKAWETTMTAHYGRLPGTKAADWTPEKPQQIDAFVKPGTRADHAGPVFVIDQVNPKTGRFDEHKVIFGASNEAEAEAIYRSNYTPGWQGLGSITRLDDRAFKEWAYDGTQKSQPVGRLDRWQGRPVPQPAPDRAPEVQRPSPGPVAGPGVAPAAPSSQRPAPVAAPAPTAAPNPPAAPAPGLRVGMTPNDTVPVTVRDGTVYLGDEPALDYETGDPVKVPAGANALQIRKALTDSKSLGSRQKFFGGAASEAPAPAPTAAPASTSEPKRGAIGMKLAAGEVVTTSSGRKTSPFPKVDISNNGKTQNTIKRVNDWLFSEALAEARSRGDNFNARQFEAVNRLNPSPADKDSAEEYLFGQQPPVVPSILKPLTPAPKLGETENRPASSRQPAPVLESEQLGEKKSPSPAPAAEKQTAAQRAAAQREVQREIHAQLLADASMDGKSVAELESIIRERAAAAPMPADKVTALAKAVHKELARTKAERAKAEHRHPAVYDKAVATAVASAYPDADVPVEQHGAFLDGFRHGMAGKTKSTLTGDHLPDRQKGYEAALRWRKTEEGAAWFEGRPVNKLQNTGMDLRRHWEAMRAQMKAGESDVKKAWAQIERATTRADLFAPLVPEGSTPGWKLYVNRVRDNTRTFKDWLFEQQHRWYGASEWGRRHRKEGDPGNLEFVLDGSRYPGDFDTATRQKWETSEAFRIQWLQDQAQAYLNRVDEFIAFLKGEKTVQSAAAMFQAKYVEPGRARDFADKRAKGRFAVLSTYDLSDDGRKESSTAGMWDGKHHNFTSLALVSEWAEKLAQDEDAAQLPTKAQPLTPPRLDRVTRAGMPDHRGGENVTPEAFKESFGLADVGFGTWVGAKEDQDHLNYSFDAFNDLAKHFGARPKDLGFGGRLHFTIGALGHGKFAAHFQRAQPAPDGSRVQVINVTNTRGDGTLYHEWVHALDHNLGGEWGSEYKTGPVRRAFLNMLMYRVPKPADVDAEAAKFLIGGWYWSGDKRLDKVGAAIRAMETFKGSRTGKTAYKQNADNLGKDYWGNPEELIARAAEAWAVDTLVGTNTYLVNPAWAGDGAITKEKGYRGTPYPSGDERKVFAEVFGALTRAIKWKGGQPTVTLADFRKELPDWMAEGEARRKELLNRDKMVELQERLLRQQAEQKAAAQMQKEAKEREEQQRMDALAAQQLRELEAAQQPAIVDEAPPSETSGPLDASDLEDIFDQAAAELREENQERPEVEPPPDADTEPVEPPAPRAGRPTPADVQHLIEKIEGGQMVLLSGAKWAEDAGIPTIHVFTKMPGEVRHAGFGVMDYTGPEFSGNFLAGGAMSRAPDGTAYTDFTVTAGRWEYPKARVLESLRKMNPGTMTQTERDIAASGRRPAPAPEDPRAADLIAQAAKLGVKGANEALTGLAKLFGAGPGKLMSFPAGLNEETYQQAKPHFKAALTAFQEAGKTLKDLFKLLIVNFGDGVKPYAIRFAQEEGLTAKLGTATAGEPSPSFKLARTIATRLDNGQAFDWRELFAWADSLFDGTQAQGKYTPKDAYDALEMGVNLHLMGQPVAYGTTADTATAGATVKALERLLQLIPTQSKRTQEQNDFQQFSTVPTLAYMANWVANVNAADTMMEPSAGLGGLAVFAKNAGARLVLNELAARRAELLREVFPGAAVHQENAEQINNILPEDIQPSVVVMNPPFSNSATRGVKKDTMVGAQHVEQALLRLAPGGRLVAIVGEGMARDKATFRDWWKKIDAAYDVRAAVPIDGSGYAKYGTTFDNVLLVIDKVSPSGRPVLTTKVTQYTELPTLLQEIRNDRPSPELAADDNGIRERDASERAHQDAVSAGESDAGAGDAAGGPGVVGEGESAGSGGRGRNRRPGGGGGGGKRRPGLRSDGDAGVDAGNDAGTGGADADGATAVSVGEAAEQTNTSELTASIFEAYRPQRLEVDGAQPHPGALVQSAAMATVLPPKPTYTPNLPAKTITSGLVSIAQLEAVVYAGQAHQEMLDPITVRDANDVGFASGGTERQVSYRRGYFIGDGTGVGKGREIGAIILDNLRQGRKKHVWISEKQGLMVDAKRDFKGVGGNADLIFNQNKTDAEGKIDAADGILFTTYSTLRSGSQAQALGQKPANAVRLMADFPPGTVIEWHNGSSAKRGEVFKGKIRAGYGNYDTWDTRSGKVLVESDDGYRLRIDLANVLKVDGIDNWRAGRPDPKAKKAGQSRLDQLVAWLGPDFDGVIAFDEAHNAGNAVPIKVSGRGTSEPSQQALAVVELQKRLPNARVVYVSATGATQVSNLSYATRLGLWGPGTPFPTVDAFIAEMTAGGLATMELVARDMKQMGVYLARSLSYAGVTYSRVEHELTPVQRAIYDRLAEAWQVVLQNFEKALEVTGGDKSSKAKGAARSAFWGQQQRFFNQVITSMQMPTVIEQMQRDLDAGDALVLQLVNTNEAQQERALGKTKDGDEGAELEELDLTPRDGLLQMVEKAFPVVQYEEVEEDGKKSMRAVLDAGGNPVLNREAVAMRDKLLRDLKDIKVPEGPLEQVINHFGPDVVAEVTGRSRRVVEKYDPRTKEKRPQIENRGPAAARADAGAFQEDKKRILIFSDAGGTGFSFHADRTAKNQRKRKHYLLQPGWRADKAVQGLGRTHRTNAASDPHYYLASTDIPAQKRFLSAIAHRLDTLGALTKGQRDTANQGMFSEKDNLESIYATQAVRQFLEDLQRGLIRDGDLNFQEFMRQTGMEDKVDPDTGRIPENKIPDTRLFLNRMLSLKLDMQAKVFDLFARLMEQKINQAIERGEFDAGLQTLKALSASVKRDEVVYTDPRSGAQTRYVELELTQPTTIHPFPEDSPARPYTYQVNERSGKVWVQVGSYESTDRKTGAVLTRASLMSTSGYTSRQLEEMATGFRKITKDEARALWEAENEAKPKTYTESAHMIVGAMLPIWDRLKSDSFFTKVQVMRTQTDDGRRYLGRVIEPGDLSEVLKRLNVQSAAAKMTPAQALAAVLKGAKGELANGWTLERVRVSNDVRVELKAGRYWSNAQIAEMKSLGMLHEQIQWSDRVFVPTGASGAEALGRLFKTKPLVDLVEPKSSGEAQFSRSTSTSSQTLTASEIEDSVSRLTRDWLRRPDIHVLESMDEAPEAVRRVWQRQNSQGGTGDVEGFHYRGGVYLVASALESEADVRRVLFHESLGHFGLRNVFGNQLKPILQQIATMRQALVRAKAKQYGLDMNVEAERLMAAEEVLAELAQSRPELGWVQRTISAIRRWLRAHGVSLGLSDNDIIADYILPARGWVERGRAAAPSIMRGPAMAARSNAGRDPFYSALAAEVDKIGAKAMPGMGWQSALNGLVNKGAVKADEVEWSGIREWLGLQQGKVSKEAVLAYLDANGVKVQEVTLGGDPLTAAGADARRTQLEDMSDEDFRDEAEELLGIEVDDDQIQQDNRDDLIAEIMRQEADSFDSRGNDTAPTKHGQWVLPGGENYREVLLTLPSGDDQLQVTGHPSGEGYALMDRSGEYVRSGPESVVPGTIKQWGSRYFAEEYGKNAHDAERKKQYRSGHWDQPNVLAHIRLNDRTDAEGKRVLFVEELQSDFAQDARKRGINKPPTAEQRAEMDAIQSKISDGTATIEDRGRYTELAGRSDGVPSAPFIDSTDKWLTLALKRVMVMAAQEGYDRVAFVNGKQSAERYDLSKQVDEIRHLKQEDGTYDLAITPVGGRSMMTLNGRSLSGLRESDLEEIVGKEVAKKIVAEEGPRGGDRFHKLSGLDLKVGGEGMRSFYDKIVPAAVNKLLAKVGGGKLEEMVGSADVSQFSVERDKGEFVVARGEEIIAGPFATRSEALKRMREEEGRGGIMPDGQMGFTITTAMREKLARGMPMFSRQGDQTETPAFRAWFKGSKVVDDQGKPLVVYHGTRGDFSAFAGDKVKGRFPNSEGFYFTSRPSHASTYADSINNAAEDFNPASRFAKPVAEGANVMPAFVRVENPKVITVSEWGTLESAVDGDGGAKVRAARAAGHDGVIVKRQAGDEWDGMLVIVFKPEQIKSAIGNSGAFDPENPDITFSRAARSETINSAVDHVNTLVRDVPGKLSWWHKTVGTMQNLALRSPQFKRVYDGVQNFLNDVSFYATEAADLAPTILPKLETWSDLTKSPLSAEDTKALQAPVFEGTLKWTRGEDGQPVEEPDPQQAGIVWTPEELRDRFQLTGERQANGKWSGQIGLYREARDALDKSLTNLAVSDMLRFAGRDAAPIASMVMELGSVGEAADTLGRYIRSLADADPARASVLNDTADKIDAKAARAQDLIRRGYAPLSRFGTYTLEATLPTGERYFGMFETQAERAKMLRTLNVARAGEITQGTLSQEAFKIFAGVSPETLELFGDLLGLESQGDGAGARAFQEYLKAAKSNRSAMKRLIERKGIAGFSEDVGRVLAGFIYSNARQTSSNLHMGEMTQSLTALKDGDKTQGELLDTAVKLVDYIKNPQEEAQALRGLLFAQYIGGSVASALVNMTQPITMTLPWLSQYGGIAKAGKQLAAAARDAGKTNTGDARLDAALHKAAEEGIVSPQEVHQLMAQAMGRGSLRAGDGTMLGDATAKAGNALSKVSLAWGKGFSLAEQFNRRVTFIAAYRNAVERGLADPSGFAEQAVAETQGVYNKGNKPAWARGAVGSTVFTFKQYSIAYVEMLHRMATRGGPEGKRAALYALAILFLLSGAGGLPGADDLDDLISGVLQSMGYNFDSKAKRKEFLTGLLGQAGADFMERGVSGIAGVPIDVSGRLGLGNLIPGTGLLTKKTDHTRDVAEIAGPAGDFANRAFQAGASLAKGEVGKAVNLMSPVAVQNLAKAYDMANMGMYRDKTGKKVIDTDGYDAFAKAVGFQPNDVKRVQDATSEVQRRVALNKMRETEIADAWAQGVFEKDQDKVKAARDALAQWNDDNPSSPIRINAIQIGRRVREMRMPKDERIAKTAPVEIRAAVRRELESAR